MDSLGATYVCPEMAVRSIELRTALKWREFELEQNFAEGFGGAAILGQVGAIAAATGAALQYIATGGARKER